MVILLCASTHKKRKSLSLGIFPDVTLANARQLRAEARSLDASNVDPKEHRDKIQKVIEQEHLNTLMKVSADWFNLKKTKVTNDYGEDLWRSLENQIFPKIG